MKQKKETKEQRFARIVGEILYWNDHDDCFDPDQEWDVEMLDMIASALEKEGLSPLK